MSLSAEKSPTGKRGKEGKGCKTGEVCQKRTLPTFVFCPGGGAAGGEKNGRDRDELMAKKSSFFPRQSSSSLLHWRGGERAWRQGKSDDRSPPVTLKCQELRCMGEYEGRGQEACVCVKKRGL